MKYGKRFKAGLAKVDKKKFYSIEDAVAIVKETATAKFNESVDIAVRLGVDPKKADQAIRGTVSLPHGIGKEVRVPRDGKTSERCRGKSSGADYAGLQEFVEKIQGGWADIDVIIAAPDVMVEVGKLGKIVCVHVDSCQTRKAVPLPQMLLPR